MPSHLTVLFSELAARPERALRRPRSGEGAGFQNVAHAAGPAVIDGRQRFGRRRHVAAAAASHHPACALRAQPVTCLFVRGRWPGMIRW